MPYRFIVGSFVVCLGLFLTWSQSSLGDPSSSSEGGGSIHKKITSTLSRLETRQVINAVKGGRIVKRVLPTATPCALAVQQFVYDSSKKDLSRNLLGQLPTTPIGSHVLMLAELDLNDMLEDTDWLTGNHSITMHYRNSDELMVMIFDDEKSRDNARRRLSKAGQRCRIAQSKKVQSFEKTQLEPLKSLVPVPASLQAQGQGFIHDYRGQRQSSKVAILADGQEALAARLKMMDRAIGPGTRDWLQTHIYMADPSGMIVTNKLIEKRAAGTDVAVTIDSQSVFWDFRDLYYNANTAVMFNNLMAWGVKVRGFQCFDVNKFNKLKWKLAKLPSNGSQYWAELVRSFRVGSIDPIYSRVHQKIHVVTNSEEHPSDEVEDAFLAIAANNKTFDDAYKISWDGPKRPSCFNAFDPINEREDYLAFAKKHSILYFKRKPTTDAEKILSKRVMKLEEQLAHKRLLPSFFITKSYHSLPEAVFEKGEKRPALKWPVRIRKAASFGIVRLVLSGYLGKTGVEHFHGLLECYEAILALDLSQTTSSKKSGNIRDLIVGGRNIGADYFELEGRKVNADDKERLTAMDRLHKTFISEHHDQKLLRKIRKSYRVALTAQQKRVFNRWRDMEVYVVAGDAPDETKRSKLSSIEQGLFIQNRPSKSKGHNVIKDYVVELIGKASQRIRILSAYYTPDAPIVAALEAARRRGVQIEIITNDVIVNDLPPVSALTDYWGLEHFAYVKRGNEPDIKLFYFDGRNRDGIPTYGTNHSKMIIIDDHIAGIMSWNMDGRSMGHVGFGSDFSSVNQEDAFFFAADPERNQLIVDLIAVFNHDRSHSRRVHIDELIEGYSISTRLLLGRAKLWEEKRSGFYPNQSWADLKLRRRNLILGLVFPGPSFF